MPSSYPENIPLIIQTIARLKPKSVLDIGFGRGKYGFLIREYFPPTNNKKGWQEIPRVDGVEIFEPYITDLQIKIYDRVFIGNALETDYGGINGYDLYLLIDVVEHWKKEETIKLIERLIKKGNVIISTPKIFTPQKASRGNQWEEHISHWNIGDFSKYNFEDISNNISTIVVLLKKND